MPTFRPEFFLLDSRALHGQILAEIANEQGLLREQAKGWQGFLHLTLQEYFVAHYVTDHQLLDALVTHRGDPWWEEVLLLYAGYTADASPLLHKLLEYDEEGSLQDDLFYTNLLLAGQCLAARPTVQDVSLWETVIAHLFEVLTTTRYALTQQHVAETLASIGSTEINTHLLPLLANQQVDAFVRQVIANALGELGERSVARELVSLLANQQVDRLVRQNIARALELLVNDERTIRALVELLATSDVADDIHRARWSASRRVGIRISMTQGPEGEHLEIVKWSST